MGMMDWGGQSYIVVDTEKLQDDNIENVIAYMLNNQEKYYLLEDDVPPNTMRQIYEKLQSKAQEEQQVANVRIAGNVRLSSPAILHMDKNCSTIEDLSMLLGNLLNHEKTVKSIWLEVVDSTVKTQIISQLSVLHEYVDVKTKDEYDEQFMKKSLISKKEIWQNEITKAKELLTKLTINDMRSEQGRIWWQDIADGIDAFDAYWQGNQERKIYIYDRYENQYINEFFKQNHMDTIPYNAEKTWQNKSAICIVNILIDDFLQNDLDKFIVNLRSDIPKDKLVFVLSRNLLREDINVMIFNQVLFDFSLALKQLGFADSLIIAIDALELSTFFPAYELTQNIACEKLQSDFGKTGKDDYLIGESLRHLYGNEEELTKEILLKKTGWQSLLAACDWLIEESDFVILHNKIRPMLMLLDADNWNEKKQESAMRKLIDGQHISTKRMELALEIEQHNKMLSGLLYKGVMYDISEMLHHVFTEFQYVQKQLVEESGTELYFQFEEMNSLYKGNPLATGVVDDINELQGKVFQKLHSLVESIPGRIKEILVNYKMCDMASGLIKQEDIWCPKNYQLIGLDEIIHIVKENTVILCNGINVESLTEAKECLKYYFLQEVIVYNIIEHLKMKIDSIIKNAEKTVLITYQNAIKEQFSNLVQERNEFILKKKNDFRQSASLYLQQVTSQNADIDTIEKIQKEFPSFGEMWKGLLLAEEEGVL